MYRLLFINPNSSEEMTSSIAAAARHVAASDVEIVACTNVSGPASIQGPADGEASVAGLLDLVREAAPDLIDVIVIACFDDTGLSQARNASAIPVIGIGQSAYYAAAAVADRFSVVTTLEVSIPVLEANIAASGLQHSCARVRASGVPVLNLETEPEAASRRISAEIEQAIAQDNIGSIVLGCAGMAKFARGFSQQFNLIIVDGVAAATGLGRTIAATRGQRNQN